MAARTYEFLVPPGKSPERLDLYLTHHVENATRTKVQQAITEGYVLVDGKKTRASHKVAPGEKITVELSTPAPPDVTAEEIPLDILFEDDALLVVNKPAGMVTHPAFGNYTGTLVNALLHHCRDRLSSPGGGPIRPGIVHRLDKDTSGLMVVAKDDATHAALSRQFARRTIEREYHAIVWGPFEGSTSGGIDAPLGRSKSDRKKIAVVATGRNALTEYTVLEQFTYLTLLRLRLRTGRTHQIRVHLHHIGHPVFGDPTYGGRRIAWGGTEKTGEVRELLNLIERQALHAKTLGFIHPVTKEKLRFDSALPSDMAAVLSKLRA